MIFLVVPRTFNIHIQRLVRVRSRRPLGLTLSLQAISHCHHQLMPLQTFLPLGQPQVAPVVSRTALLVTHGAFDAYLRYRILTGRHP